MTYSFCGLGDDTIAGVSLGFLVGLETSTFWSGVMATLGLASVGSGGSPVEEAIPSERQTRLNKKKEG